jgi:DNA primase
MPVDWKRLNSVMPTDFTILDAPNAMKKSSDPWKDILNKKQDIASILDNVSDLSGWAA